MNTLLRMFGTLFAINLLTVGGGYVMLPLVHSYFVEQYGWLTEPEFLDAVALGQITPGPLTIMNAFIGYKVAGFVGASAATAATYLPSVMVVTFISRHYSRVSDNIVVKGIFSGIRPALAGMLAGVFVILGESAWGAPAPAIIGLAGFCLLVWTKLDPVIVILASGVAGALIL